MACMEMFATAAALLMVCSCTSVGERTNAIEDPHRSSHNHSSMVIGTSALKQYAKKLNHHQASEKESQVLSSLNSFRRRHRGSHLLEISRRFDSDNCLVRLICEIASNSDDNADSLPIRQLRAAFRAQTVPPSYENNGSLAAFLYHYAAFVGRTTGSAEACLDTFPSCPKKTEDLLALLNRDQQVMPSTRE